MTLYKHVAMVKEKWQEHSLDVEETSKAKCEHYTSLVVYCVVLFFFAFKAVYTSF